MKITKISPITKEVKIELIKELNEDRVDEIAALGKLARGLGSAVTKTKSALHGLAKEFEKGAEAANPKPEEVPTAARAQSKSSESTLQTFVTELLQTPAGHVKVSINLPKIDLKSHYLAKNGANNLARAIVEAGPAAGSGNKIIETSAIKIHQHDSDNSLNDLASNSTDVFAILNVPSKLVAELKNTASRPLSTDQDRAKLEQDLTKFLSHHSYIASFLKSKVSAVPTAAEKDVDKVAEIPVSGPNAGKTVLDAIFNHPDSSTLALMRKEVSRAVEAAENAPDEEDEKQVQRLMARGDRAVARRSAERKIAGSSSEFVGDIASILMSTSDASTALTRIESDYLRPDAPSVRTKAEIIAALNEIGSRLPSPKIDELIRRLSATP